MTREEQEFEFEVTRNYELGIGAGHRQVAGLLLTKATEAYVRCDDKEADLLRTLSQELKAEGDKLAENARNKVFTPE